MAAMSSLKNLPDGYCLNPRDEDIINYYLIRKIKGIPNPEDYCFIPEINIYEYEPQDLIALYDSMSSINSNGLECFFFCKPVIDPDRKCVRRNIAGGKKGFWQQTGKGSKNKNTDQLRWAKLIFCHRLGTRRNSELTDWVMHEFRLLDYPSYVLCRITNKHKKKLSASAAEKRKVDSNETHLQTSPESCVLNNRVAKKSKNNSIRQSPLDNPSLQEASYEASSSSTVTNPAGTWLDLLSATFIPEMDINHILKHL